MSMSTSTTTVGVTEYINWSDFGSFLTKLRCRRGLSQEVFAAQVGCHRTHIWRLEHGRNHPSRLFLRNLRTTYQLSLLEDTLLNGFQYLYLYRVETAPLPTVFRSEPASPTRH